MSVAVKTLAAMEHAIAKDGGATWRGLQRQALADCEDAYDTDTFPFRSHLGSSLMGRPCERAAWYTFRWAAKEDFEPRMLRLFNRGHIEEGRVVALLRAAGFIVHTKTEAKKQYCFSGVDGHYGGSIDGVIEGIPDLPKGMPALGEFKTHNTKSFNHLKGNGLLAAKWEHYVQMQLCMSGMKLEAGVYFAVNKDDDEIWAEVIRPDPTVVVKYQGKAASVISSPRAPAKINSSPTWYVCRFCSFKQVCHNGGKAAANCRTCYYSVSGKEGKWHCTWHNRILSKEDQLLGCENHKDIVTGAP